MASYPLIIDGTAPTAAEYVALNYRRWRQRGRTRFNDVLLALALLLLATSVGTDVAGHGRIGGSFGWSTLALLAFTVAYAFARGPLVRRQLRQLYARNVVLHSPTRFTLGPEGLRGQHALASFEAQWATIRRAVRLGPWLLLYPTETACYYLDLRHLQPPATEADVLSLLQAQGVAVKS